MIARPSVRVHKGKRFITFYGANNPNGVCSNFYKIGFVIDGVYFRCVEQYMMYCKAITFGDKETAQKIINETEPKNMKKYGRQVKNYDDAIWSEKRYNVVLRGVQAKFTQNVGLKDWMETARADYYVECSPSDNIWGIQMEIDNPNVIHPNRWRGQNLLGKILKEVQDSILNSTESQREEEE